MSHNIHTCTYPENVDKAGVQAEWDDYAAHEDWQEGCSGLPGRIRWINTVCESEEEAEEWIKRNDSGWYDQLAVKFRHYPPAKPSAKETELAGKIAEMRKTLSERDGVKYATTVKSTFIGCKKCESKIASSYIQNTNRCPVCGNDFRSETTLNSLNALRRKITENEKKLNEMREAAAKKNKPEIRWLVKIEYHT